MRAIGLMSGTSLDGIDAAVVDVESTVGGLAIDVVRFETYPFPAAVREALFGALPPNVATPADLTRLDGELGRRFAHAARTIARGEEIDFVASHGLTAYHDGASGETMQIGDPYRIRDAVGASVVFDFRRADCAAGGNGAPLVPYVDALLFGSDADDVVALNLGGIANVTVLPRGTSATEATAWDTGPGNMLIDAFVRERTHGAESFDRDGERALRGHVDARVVAELCAREVYYLVQPPPKSTGRERFGAQLLHAQADLFANLSLDDGCATLCAFTVATVCDGLALYGPAAPRVVASGGGTRNHALLTMLRARLEAAGATLVRSDRLGIDPDAKEAVAFALLGYETLRGRPANLPGVTGAERPVVLGAVVPHRLDRLLAKMRDACASNGGA